MNPRLSRRELLHHSVTLTALATLGPASAACSKSAAPLACNDTSTMAPADLTIRNALAYVEPSADPGKACSRCQQFIPGPSEASCGTCKIVKGSINPNGSCKSFAPKT